MSSLFLRKQSVWIKFKDQFGVSHRRATGFRVDNPPSRGSSIVWPAEIRQFKRELDRAIALGTWGLEAPHRSPRISGFLQEHLSTVASSLNKSTKDDYRRAVGRLITFAGDLPLNGFTEEVLTHFRSHLLENLSAVTARKTLRSLGALFNAAVERRHIQRSPVTRKMNVQISSRAPRPFHPAELEQFLAAVQNVNEPLFHHCQFGALTGFRSDEICQLRWDDIHMDDLVIYVRNAKEHRVDPFPVDDVLKEFLQSLPHTYAPFVFHYRNTTSISHNVRKVLDKLDMDPQLSFHALRRTFARNVVASTNNIQVAQELCRHRSLQTTLKHYSWFSMDEKRAALSRTRRAG